MFNGSLIIFLSLVVGYHFSGFCLNHHNTLVHVYRFLVVQGGKMIGSANA